MGRPLCSRGNKGSSKLALGNHETLHLSALSYDSEASVLAETCRCLSDTDEPNWKLQQRVPEEDAKMLTSKRVIVLSHQTEKQSPVAIATFTGHFRLVDTRDGSSRLYMMDQSFVSGELQEQK